MFDCCCVAAWVGAMSTGVALMVSPVTFAFCRKKSTRLTAVMGGLVTALGVLFTSFATQFHQIFISYGAILGKEHSEVMQCLPFTSRFLLQLVSVPPSLCSDWSH